jgi:hypothetical protein
LEGRARAQGRPVRAARTNAGRPVAELRRRVAPVTDAPVTSSSCPRRALPRR